MFTNKQKATMVEMIKAGKSNEEVIAALQADKPGLKISMPYLDAIRNGGTAQKKAPVRTFSADNPFHAKAVAWEEQAQIDNQIAALVAKKEANQKLIEEAEQADTEGDEKPTPQTAKKPAKK